MPSNVVPVVVNVIPAPSANCTEPPDDDNVTVCVVAALVLENVCSSLETDPSTSVAVIVIVPPFDDVVSDNDTIPPADNVTPTAPDVLDKMIDVQVVKPLIDVKYVDLNKAKESLPVGEVLSSESMTEQSGYIDPKRQIEDMIMAGHRLDEARPGQFDFDSEDEIDEDAYDPTRSGNYDLSDASQQQYEAESRIREQRLKASQTAQNGSGGVSEPSQGGNEPPPEKGA